MDAGLAPVAEENLPGGQVQVQGVQVLLHAVVHMPLPGRGRYLSCVQGESYGPTDLGIRQNTFIENYSTIKFLKAKSDPDPASRHKKK